MLLDCTLRDGGYYNAWDFSRELIVDYLEAVAQAGVDVVEIGFRSLDARGFKGACAYSRDDFIRDLPIPDSLRIGVMVNASDLLAADDPCSALTHLFPVAAQDSPVSLVRIACHTHEVSGAKPAVRWLVEQGYQVGLNLMQIADRSSEDIAALAAQVADSGVSVLYFADSTGGLSPSQTVTIVEALRREWPGPLGVHAHDNMGMALQNSLAAMNAGVEWVDSTVTGMGRGPGNTRTEDLCIELASLRSTSANLVPLMKLIRQRFQPMKSQYGWGTNPYYYLSGKYGIHPSYVQEMLHNGCYDEEDILAAIEHLRVEGGKRFSLNTLEASRQFYRGDPIGRWSPASVMAGREVLLLGTGPGVRQHVDALRRYVRRYEPMVLALNTQPELADLIDLRVACHPVRLVADCEEHTRLPQPLITPASMLPEDVRQALSGKTLLDFGLTVTPEHFAFSEHYCATPSSLVAAYALAIAASGKASRVLLAGFDGYGSDDERTVQMRKLIQTYSSTPGACPLTAITPSQYGVPTESVYARA